MVDIVYLFVADVYFDEVLHRLDDVFADKRKVFDVVFVVEFFVELIAANSSQIVAAFGKEHGRQIFFGGFDGDRFSRHEYLVHGGKHIFFSRLHIDGTFFDVAHFFALKTVDDHLRIERFVFFVGALAPRIEFDDDDFAHAVCDEIVDFVRVQADAGIEQALFFVRIFVAQDNRAREHFIDELFTGSVIALYRYFFRRIKTADDLLARIVAERTQQNRTEDFLFAVDFRKDQFFLLIDFEFEPRTAVRDDAARIDALIVAKDDARRSVNL